MPAVHERLVDLLERLFLQRDEAEEAKDDLDGYLRRHGFEEDDISGEAVDSAMQDVAMRLSGPSAGLFSAYTSGGGGGGFARQAMSVTRGSDAPPRPPARLRGESDGESGRRVLQQTINNIRQGDTYNIDNSIDQRGSVNATAATGGSTAQGGQGNRNLIDDDGPDVFRGPGRLGGRPGFRGDDDGDDGNINQAGSTNATAATGGSIAQGGRGNTNIIDDGPDVFRGPGRPGGRPGLRGDDGDDGNVNQVGSTNATAATGGSIAQGGRGNTNIIDDDPDGVRGPGGRPAGGVGQGPGGRPAAPQQPNDPTTTQTGGTTINAPTTATGGGIAAGGVGNQIGIQSQTNSPGAQAGMSQTHAAPAQHAAQPYPVDTAPPVAVDPHSGQVAGLQGQEATQAMSDSPHGSQGITQHQDPTAYVGQDAGQAMSESAYGSQEISQSHEEGIRIEDDFGTGHEATQSIDQETEPGYYGQDAGEEMTGSHGDDQGMTQGHHDGGTRIEDDFGLGDEETRIEDGFDQPTGGHDGGTRIEDDFGLGAGQSNEAVELDETTGMHAGTMPAEEHVDVDDSANVYNTGQAEAQTSPYEHTAPSAPIQDPVEYEPPREEAQYEEPEPVPNYEAEPVYMHEEPQADPGGEGYAHGGGESM